MKQSSNKKIVKLIDSIVESKINKLLPQIVEQEVNRVLTESTQQQPKTTQPQQKPKFDKNNITESLRSMVGDDMNEWRTVSYNTQTGIPGVSAASQHMTTHDGRPIDTSNDAVKSVAQKIFDPSMGERFKKANELAKKRNGRI
jgi:copper homeostasis protein CutC